MTVSVDFDGVIHRYSKGWRGGDIYDPPIPGAIKALGEMYQEEAVFVLTASNEARRHDIVEWLERRGLTAIMDDPYERREFWNDKGVILVTNRKYPARRYLDDRGVTFRDWEQAMRDLGFRHEPGCDCCR